MNTAALLLLALDLFLKSSLVVLLAATMLAVWRRTSAAQRSLVWGVTFAIILLLPFSRLASPHWRFSLPKDRPAPTIIAPSSTPAAGETKPVTVETSLVASPAPARPHWNAIPTIAVMWAFGVFLLLAYRAIGSLTLRHLYSTSSPAPNGSCRDQAHAIATSYGITRPVDLRLGQTCHVPMTWGTRRPVVMLPAHAAGQSRPWLEAVLRHELAHVRNFDHLKRWLSFLTCALNWPNPFVWYAAKQFHLAQEEASDNLVLETGISPQIYATQLVETIRTSSDQSALSLPAVAMARLSTMEGRLLAILDDKRNRQHSGQWLGISAILAAVGLSFASSIVQLRAEDSSGATAAILPPTESAQELKDTVKAFAIPSEMDFKQVPPVGALNAVIAESRKAHPQGIPIQLFAPFAPKVDLQLGPGSLLDAFDAVAKQAGLQYQLSPLYVFYMDEIGAPLRPHLDKICCTFWPANSPEPLIGRSLSVSEQALRILHLPEPNGDAKESLGKWGVQFPAGSSAAVRPLAGHPDRYVLVINNTSDQVTQVINLLMAAAPDDWMPKSQPKPETPAAAANSPDDSAALAKLIQKVNTLIIPSLDLNQVAIGDAIQVLTAESKKADPDHQGVNFILRLPAPTTKIDLKGSSLLLKDVLNSIANQTKLQYSVNEYAVYFRSSLMDKELLTVRTFLVPDQVAASFLAKPPASGDVSQAFANVGIMFPVGAKATYLPGPKKLVVRNTPTQLDLIEKFFNAFPPSAPH